jgi:hypothetical protein
MPYQIKNGKVYGSNAVSLTQAQYDALSTAEKNNGTVYYIYDSEAVLDASDVSLGSGTVEDLAGSVAVIETSPTTATHAVGDYIVWNGQLYEVTTAIAVGETLTVGTNISAVSVGGELTSLNKGLATNITIERKEITFGKCSPNVDYSKTIDINKTGYSALGIVGFQIAGTYGTHFHVSKADITSYTNAVFSIRANSTLTFTTDNTVISFVVLYKQRRT